jgi:hypothetical protein
MKIAIDNIFKSNDRVYHYKYGWGTIIDMGKNVVFDERLNLIMEVYSQRNFLSFTRYSIEGFSQERPEELPEKGDIVWGRNEFPSEWHIGHFFEKQGDYYLISSHPKPTGWNNKVIEITTINPYKQQDNGK